jgi:hypothetical protein
MALVAAVLATRAAWNRQPLLAGVAAAIAIALAILATIRPQWLKHPARGWFGLAHLLHRLTTPVSLFAIYWVAVVPTALIARWCGHDPFRRRGPRPASYWVERKPGQTPFDARRQF